MTERLTFSPGKEVSPPLPPQSEQQNGPSVFPLQEDPKAETEPTTTSSAEATVFESPTRSFTPATKELDRVSRRMSFFRIGGWLKRRMWNQSATAERG